MVTQCPWSAPVGILLPRNIWANRAEYDATAHRLAGLFRDNFHEYENFCEDSSKGRRSVFAQGRMTRNTLAQALAAWQKRRASNKPRRNWQTHLKKVYGGVLT